jgi:hypothetical protein
MPFFVALAGDAPLAEELDAGISPRSLSRRRCWASRTALYQAALRVIFRLARLPPEAWPKAAGIGPVEGIGAPPRAASISASSRLSSSRRAKNFSRSDTNSFSGFCFTSVGLPECRRRGQLDCGKWRHLLVSEHEESTPGEIRNEPTSGAIIQATLTRTPTRKMIRVKRSLLFLPLPSRCI